MRKWHAGESCEGTHLSTFVCCAMSTITETVCTTLGES